MLLAPFCLQTDADTSSGRVSNAEAVLPQVNVLSKFNGSLVSMDGTRESNICNRDVICGKLTVPYLMCHA